MRIQKLISALIITMSLVYMASCLAGNSGVQEEFTAEQERINLNAYLDALHSQGYDIDTTELGIYYVILEEGSGDFPKSGDTLEVGYAGYFIDGQLFDASDLNEEGGTFEFILGNPPMIAGWDNGMQVIKKDAKVELIVPSEFGYGSEGSGVIPPYSTLIFVVKMIDLRPV